MDVARGGEEGGKDRRRELACSAYCVCPMSWAWRLLEDAPGDEDVGRLLVRARNPRTFFQGLTQLVLERVVLRFADCKHLDEVGGGGTWLLALAGWEGYKTYRCL